MPQLRVLFKNTKEDQQIVEGLVYSPNLIDAHGDYISPAGVMKLYKFFNSKKNKNMLIDTDHDRVSNGSYCIDNYINGVTKKNGVVRSNKAYPIGAWVMAVKVPETEVWEKVKSKELNAFSMDFYAAIKEVDVTAVIVKENFGKTSIDADHDHDWILDIDDNGLVIGGRTSFNNGHDHVIPNSAVKTAFAEYNGVKHKHRVK